MKEVQYDKYLENRDRSQVKKSRQFELLYNQMENDAILRGQHRSYSALIQLVRRHLDRETRGKHLEAKQKHLGKGFPCRRAKAM